MPGEGNTSGHNRIRSGSRARNDGLASRRSAQLVKEGTSGTASVPCLCLVSGAHRNAVVGGTADRRTTNSHAADHEPTANIVEAVSKRASVSDECAPVRGHLAVNR